MGLCGFLEIESSFSRVMFEPILKKGVLHYISSRIGFRQLPKCRRFGSEIGVVPTIFDIIGVLLTQAMRSDFSSNIENLVYFFIIH